MLKLLARGLAYLQSKLPVNRVVVLVTPLFVAASAWAVGYVAKTFPYLPHFTSGQITALMVAGAASALTAAYRWLKGWEAHEARTAK